MPFLIAGGAALVGALASDALAGDPTSAASSSPWGPQQPYLESGFAGAQDLYNQGPMQYYPGQTVAGINPNMQSYMSGVGGYTESAIGGGQYLQTQGRDLSGSLNQAQDFYTGAADSYFNPYASAQYNQQIADSVANNPVLNDQIQQGQQDINRNLQENILPSIGAGAAATGNTGSTRRGVAEGVAMRGAMEQGSDLATNLQANAYNQGINQAGDWARGEQFGQNYQMQGANQLANIGQVGSGQMMSGYGMGSGAYQDLLGAGAYERGLEQQQLGDEQARFDYAQLAPWENLQRYQQAISGDYGGTTTSTASGPSTANQLAQMGTQLGGAYLMSGGYGGGGGGGYQAPPINFSGQQQNQNWFTPNYQF